MKKIILLSVYSFILSSIFALPDASIPTEEFVRVQDGHTDTINEILFSPDSRYIATAGNDFTVRIWDLEQDRLIGVFPLFKEITALKFSPDNGYFAACTEDQILLWDIKSNKISYPDFTDPFTFTSLAFTADSANLIIAGLDPNFYFFNIRTGGVNQVLNDFDDNYQQISYINLTPDKKNIVAAGGKTVKRTVWRILTKNIKTGELTNCVVAKHKGRIKSLSYSSDAALLVSAAYDGRIIFFSTPERIKHLTTLEEGSRLHPAAQFFPGKNDTIAFIDRDDILRIGMLEKEGDADSLKLTVKSTGTIGKPGASTFTFSPNAKYIAIANGNQLNILQNGSFNVIKSYSGRREVFYSLAFSPDGKRAASGGKNIILWDCATGKLIKRLKNGHDMVYKQLHFINNTILIARKEAAVGKLLKAGIDIFNLETESSVILPAGIPIACSVYKEDYVALSQEKYGKKKNSYSLEILKLAIEKEKEKIKNITSKSVMTIEWDHRINAVAFSGDGKIVAGGCNDGTIVFWNTHDRKPDFKLDKSNGPIVALQFSLDGKYLAYSDTSGMFYLWDAWKKRYIKEEKYFSRITSLFFSPDNSKVIAAGNSAAYIIACDGKSREVILRGHSAAIHMGLFSSDGTRFVTVSKDGTMKWWQNTDSRLLATSLVFPASYLIYSPSGYYYTPDDKNDRIIWYYKGLFLKERDSMKRQDIIKQILAGKKYEVPEKELKKIVRKNYPEKYKYAFADTKGPAFSENIPVFRNNTETGKKYAILIGISDYKQLSLERKRANLLDLKYAHKDAIAFKKFLQEQSELGGGEWDITCITNEEATNAKVDNVLSEVLRNAKEKDIIYLFFSGHARKHHSTKELYLLTYDFRPDDYRDGLDYRDLNSMIRKSRTRHIITFIDACYSGHPGGAKGSNDLLLDSIKSLKLVENKVIITSSRGEEASREDDEIRQGVFTYYLLKGLRGEAKETNNNQYVEIQELMTYIDKEIPVFVKKKFNTEQHPYEFGVISEIRYNFPLAVRTR